MQIEILNISKDANGLISAKFCIHDNGTQGAVEKFTISALEIAEKWGGDVERWIRESVAPGMTDNHSRRVAVHTGLAALKGKKLEL